MTKIILFDNFFLKAVIFVVYFGREGSQTEEVYSRFGLIMVRYSLSKMVGLECL